MFFAVGGTTLLDASSYIIQMSGDLAGLVNGKFILDGAITTVGSARLNVISDVAINGMFNIVKGLHVDRSKHISYRCVK